MAMLHSAELPGLVLILLAWQGTREAVIDSIRLFGHVTLTPAVASDFSFQTEESLLHT
jgi:hypothetical protein